MTDTQSMIAVQEKDNTVSSLVLDHDGDLETAGRILEENYQDYEQVLALVSLGDLKRLGKTAEESRAYYRDEHEDQLVLENYADTEVFDRATEDQGDYLACCFLYCKYEGDFQWLVRDFSTGDKRFKPLKEALARRQAL
ncbi:hypothetical protein FD23_GL001627 [Lactobacillus delbrueckii subsp. delbrueckii DSM 20074 = JCM 1012]|uniref:hypothetical protein n=1 Tax=Lactobacillus delbrueckii TaxID=1584 RepID=UPI000470D84D|nr:hypothetical protein [Lactobacillus delbrueckii]APP09601.1 hypothetical protein LD074_01715 [Lactobacillus delbrueckii subsp. delbrueckii DSM 20074 = JCM 1012]KNZ38232.1 hypothetical protein LDD39_03615 [Lactobacillus delbrueckii subsp. delbrueckii]KRK18306.1 hypothetical protein FD23_GL001627 [Lactobacillus delbrueckii subsp. delbrueckii DSM 20074 = JCM 1012]MCT3493794.1 hypothetical protein [Lactobacillus delbrueckii]MCT3522233.1 hypothetical protein [Lactobacillus delbrueckii]